MKQGSSILLRQQHHHSLKKNATMITIWHAGQLRIGVFATDYIPKYHAIVLDYNEHSNTYFKLKAIGKSETVVTQISPPFVRVPRKEQFLDVVPPIVKKNNNRHSPSPELDEDSSSIVIFMDTSE